MVFGGGVFRVSIQVGKNSCYGEVDEDWVKFWGFEMGSFGGGGGRLKRFGSESLKLLPGWIIPRPKFRLQGRGRVPWG